MIHAASMLGGLFALWLCLAPLPADPAWAGAGAAGALAVTVFAWRARLLDREGAPYARAPAFAIFWARRIAGAFGGALRLAAAALAGRDETTLRPALVQWRARTGDARARAAFAAALSATPGLALVACAEESVLVHVADEDRVDEGALKALETGAWRASGARP